ILIRKGTGPSGTGADSGTGKSFSCGHHTASRRPPLLPGAIHRGAAPVAASSATRALRAESVAADELVERLATTFHAGGLLSGRRMPDRDERPGGGSLRRAEDLPGLR